MFFDFVSRLHLSFINPFLRKINSCGTRLAPHIFTRRLFALVSAVIFISVPAFAFGGGESPVLPVGGSFSSGSGSISSTGPSMTINQTTSKGIINWQGFSIGQGGSVLFNNGAGATLNRVTGSSMSSIAGLLKATGSLYLINPNGIVITSTGSVITGGDFIASTLNISDSDFLNGNLSFYGTTGSVTNNGVINSSGNTVLVGTFTTNNGTLSSSGTASLVSGTRLVLIPENGPSGILISPSSLPGNVTNSGVIKAASVYLSSSGGNVYALAGNNGGLIEATGTKTLNGQVWLTAPSGSVSINSPVTASGTGGSILIDGLNNYINSNSILNASGSGGVIKIGLFPSLPESLSTNISSGAELLAGGVNGGGFIDTSGDTLSIGNITVNANGGEWLLDPEDLTIDSTAASNIDTALNTGTNVTLMVINNGTGNLITSSTVGTTTTSPSAIGTPENDVALYGDINVNAPISWGSTASLTLSAYNNINLNSNITVSGNGTLALYCNTGNVNGILNIPLNGSGFASSIKFTGTDLNGLPEGSLTINGDNYTLVNALNIDDIDVMGDSGDYALATDITAPSSFTPIGESTYFTTFSGTFNGLGHTISGLSINSSTLFFAGLFGLIGGGGSVSNLGVINENITDSDYHSSVGYLAGFNVGTITNSYSTSTGSVSGTNGDFVGGNSGTITNSYSTGGFVGNNYASGTISNSYSTGSVSVGGAYVGGFADFNAGTISNSYSTGSVTGGTYSQVGGFAGGNISGTISNSYSTGSVTGSGDGNVGGFVGENYTYSTISNSYSTGSVSGNGTCTGGFAGASAGTITNSYSTGSVSSGKYTGGLIGYNDGTVSDSYSAGTVSSIGSYDSVGGLVGWNTNHGTVSDSYSAGTVSSIGSYDSVGGLVGWNNQSTVYGSYSLGTVNNTTTTGGNGSDYIGGLVGYNSGPVSDSYSADPINNINNGNGSDFVGGFAGVNNQGAISDSYSVGDINNANNGNGSDLVGGLAGYNSGPVSNSYSSGAVTDNGAGDYIGGLVGYNSGGSYTANYWVSVNNPGGSDNPSSAVGNGSVPGAGQISSNEFTTDSYAGFTFTSTPGTQGNAWVIVDSDGTLNNNIGKSTGATLPMLASEYSLNIVNAHQLQLMDMNFSTSYTLGADIDASATGGAAVSGTDDVWGAAGFVPIGNSTTPFTGIFNGWGHAIDDLTIGTSSNPYVVTASQEGAGLFTKLGSGGTVENVGLNESIYVSVGKGSDYIGGLVGYNNGGSIANSYSESNITDNDGSYNPNSVGGFLGYNSGSISSSYSVGAVTDNTVGDHVGGFAGTDNNGTYNLDYYDMDMSGQPSACGSGLCSGITGLSDSQMKESSSFSGWLFDPYYTGGIPAGTPTPVWYQSDGYSYPLLISTNTAGTPATVDGTTYTLVNASNIDDIDSIGDSGNYALMYNITLPSPASGSNANFTPIGEATPFTGIFNGWGHTVDGLTIGTFTDPYATTSQNEGIGLFANIGSGGTVENVGVIDASIYVDDTQGHDYIGSLTGLNDGTIFGSYSTGTVTNADNSPFGQDAVGGLVGSNDNTVSNTSYSTVSVANTDNSSYGYDLIGGLVGVNWGGTISRSYAYGSVTNNDSSSMGIYGYGSDYLGGLVGDNSNGSTISISYSSGSVVNMSGSGAENAVGGLIGENYNSMVSNSYSLDSIINTGNGNGSADRVGGFVGDNDGTISDSYFAGNIYDNNTGDYVGGFAGNEDRAVPEFGDKGSICVNDYWDTSYNSSLPSAGYTYVLEGPGTITGVTPLSDSQMYESSNFAGFDFANTWNQIDGHTYPFLRAFEVKLNLPLVKNSFTLPLSAMPNFMSFIEPLDFRFGIRDVVNNSIIIVQLNRTGQKIAKKLFKKIAKKAFKKVGISDEVISILDDFIDSIFETLPWASSL